MEDVTPVVKTDRFGCIEKRCLEMARSKHPCFGDFRCAQDCGRCDPYGHVVDLMSKYELLQPIPAKHECGISFLFPGKDYFQHMIGADSFDNFKAGIARSMHLVKGYAKSGELLLKGINAYCKKAVRDWDKDGAFRIPLGNKPTREPYFADTLHRYERVDSDLPNTYTCGIEDVVISKGRVTNFLGGGTLLWHTSKNMDGIYTVIVNERGDLTGQSHEIVSIAIKFQRAQRYYAVQYLRVVPEEQMTNTGAMDLFRAVLFDLPKTTAQVRYRQRKIQDDTISSLYY